jgi:hypothetical protein
MSKPLLQCRRRQQSVPGNRQLHLRERCMVGLQLEPCRRVPPGFARLHQLLRGVHCGHIHVARR